LDSGGASVSGGSNFFTVADAPLTLTAVNAPSVTEGQSTGTFAVATFTDGNKGAPVTDFTAGIHWGAGTTSIVTSTNGLTGSGGNFVVQASHVYQEETTGTLSVQVLDAGGASTSGQATVTVADATLTVTSVNQVAGGFTEG